MFIFGSGTVIAVQTRDAAGNAISNPTPVKLMTLQDVGVDMSVDLKMLHGERKFAAAVGQGKGKIDIKAKYGNVNTDTLGLFLGTTLQTGLQAVVLDQAATIPASSPYTRDIGAGLGGGTFVANLGVYDATTGAKFTRAASPAAGKYTVSGAGVYTFAAADAGKAVVISFEYSNTTGGTYYNLSNDPMGYTPKFQLYLRNQYDGNTLLLKLNSCTSASFALPMKNEDFATSDFNASAMEDAAGNIGYLSFY